MGVAGAMVLVMLGLLLWSDAAAAACPHGMPDKPAAAVSAEMDSAAPPAMATETMTVGKMAAGRIDHGRQAPERSHHGVQPCCAGMACAAVPVGLPVAEMVSPLGSARLRLGWPAGLLHEGLGLRPDLPPPRLG